jgi:hypothetical protein
VGESPIDHDWVKVQLIRLPDHDAVLAHEGVG